MRSMRWVRIGLPVAIILAGLVAIVVSGFSETGLEGGFALIGAGLAVWLLNFFFRLGVSGDRERDAEDRARRFYDEHGYWPDERPPQPAPRADPHHREGEPRQPFAHGRRRRR
jgi:hypothetical protein